MQLNTTQARLTQNIHSVVSFLYLIFCVESVPAKHLSKRIQFFWNGKPADKFGIELPESTLQCSFGCSVFTSTALP